MDGVWRSAWFANYFAEWMPGVTDIRYVTAQYDASVAYADACLAHLFQRLTELGHWEDTLVLLCADHGEELDEHGCWFDHHGLYETNVRVPLLLRFPDGRGAGRTLPQLVSALDVAPTLLGALGHPELAGACAMPGRDLAPLLAGQGAERAVPPLEAVYLTECTWMRKRGWRTPEWKLIRALEPDIYGLPPIELFHLPSDPGEQAEPGAHPPGHRAQAGRRHGRLGRAAPDREWPPRPQRGPGGRPAHLAAPLYRRAHHLNPVYGHRGEAGGPRSTRLRGNPVVRRAARGARCVAGTTRGRRAARGARCVAGASAGGGRQGAARREPPRPRSPAQGADLPGPRGRAAEPAGAVPAPEARRSRGRGGPEQRSGGAPRMKKKAHPGTP